MLTLSGSMRFFRTRRKACQEVAAWWFGGGAGAEPPGLRSFQNFLYKIYEKLEFLGQYLINLMKNLRFFQNVLENFSNFRENFGKLRSMHLLGFGGKAPRSKRFY